MLQRLPENDTPIDFHLSEAAYAPNSSCNLLSLQMLAAKAGMHGTWDKDRITILTAAGELVGQAKLQNGMYCVQTKLDAIPMHPPIGVSLSFRNARTSIYWIKENSLFLVEI